MPVKRQTTYRRLFVLSLAIVLLSPLAYWATGIGQSASELSAELEYGPAGVPMSSPKAEALHRLALPMRIERLLMYPLLLLGFQLSGGALALRRWLRGGPPHGGSRQPFLRAGWRGWVDRHEVLAVLLFVLAFNIGLSLLYLPFNFYSGFILLHQFDLSTQTAAGWMADWFKSLLIGLAIDGVAWTGLYTLVRLMPRRWPIPAGAALMALSAVWILLAPIVITPLFYEVRPLQEADLRARILDLAARAGMQVDGVYVIDASSKTTAANAYFTGFGGAQRIVFYDTMLTGYTAEQFEVTLAHEMGHWYYHHVLLGWLGMGAVAWIGLFGLRWLLNRTWQRLGLSGPADVAGLPYILAVVALVSTLAMPIENTLSRYSERQADRFSLVISQEPAAFIDLFERLAVQNLAMVDAPGWEVFVFYTHPTIVERIRMGEQVEKNTD